MTPREEALVGPDWPLEECELSVRAANCARCYGIGTVRQLAACRSRDVARWANAGAKTLTELRAALARYGLSFADEGVGPSDGAMPKPPEKIEASSLEEELLGIARRFATSRNADIVVKLWGWSGGGHRTLDSVGKEYGLTRERVRQIERKVITKLLPSRIDLQLVPKAIEFLAGAVPDSLAGLAIGLRHAGISNIDFSIDGLELAAERLDLDWPFEYVKIKQAQLLAKAGRGTVCRKAVSLVRRKSSKRGCVNVLGLASELKLNEEDLPGLRRVLKTVPEFVWLDDSEQWLFSSHGRNRLYNLCAKVFGVTSSLHISELRRAVSRSRRMAMSPPQGVLTSFVKLSGLGQVDGSFVVANPGVGYVLPEDSAEAVMLSVLDAEEPVLYGEDFAEKCIEAGVNAITFYIYRRASPVITPLGNNLFCKVGAEIAPGTIEAVLASRKAEKRLTDHGWTSSGRLWAGTELSRIVITFGSIGLPTFVADLVQGEWGVTLPDDSEYGTVVCRDNFIWSFAKQLALLGAEPGDIVILEFDLKARKVTIRVGGLELFEAVEDSIEDADIGEDED